jgi:hypothetical protein
MVIYIVFMYNLKIIDKFFSFLFLNLKAELYIYTIYKNGIYVFGEGLP